MICPKCKKEIEDDSKFCEFCGSKIDIKENRQVKEKRIFDKESTRCHQGRGSLLQNVLKQTLTFRYLDKIKKLERKTWYRALKVVYILSFLVAVIFILYTVYEEKAPRKVVDQERSVIICDNGKEYIPDSEDYIGEIGMISFEAYKKFGRICSDKGYASGDIGSFAPKVEHKTEGSWLVLVVFLVLSVLAVALVFEVIKRIFYYIVLGSKKLKK